MVKLTKIYQKDDKGYREWNGKEPGPNTAIFVTVILDNDWVKRIVFSNCGDLMREEHSTHQIQDWPLEFTIPGHFGHPTGIGSFLKLSNSSSTLSQPLFIRDCWPDVTFLLKKFMSEGKIFKFEPISGIKRSSNRHTFVEKPYDYTFFLDFSSIPYTETQPYTPPFFSSNPIFTNPTIDIPESEFKNPKLYTPFYNYIPSHISERIIAAETGSSSLSKSGRPYKRQKIVHEGGGKSRRRVKRRFKRKTIKRINKRNKRKTIKRRFKKR
jgi:hypothetical protein